MTTKSMISRIPAQDSDCSVITIVFESIELTCQTRACLRVAASL